MMQKVKRVVAFTLLAISSVLELELVSIWMRNVWHDMSRFGGNLPFVVSAPLSAWARIMYMPWELAVLAGYIVVAVRGRRAEETRWMLSHVMVWIFFPTLAIAGALIASLPYRYCCLVQCPP